MMRHKTIWAGLLLFVITAGIAIVGYWRQFVIPSDLIIALDEDSRIVIDLSERFSGTMGTEFVIDRLPTKGWLKGTLPVITYQPQKDFFGEDFFYYSVSSRWGGSYTATVRLTIIARNDPPKSKNGQTVLNEDEQASVTLSAFDPDGDPLSYLILKPPLHGSITGLPPDLVYIPNPDFFGKDHLVFVARDGEVDSQPGTVYFDVIGRNDPPVVRPVSVITYRGFPVSIAPNVTDPDNTDLQLVRVTNPKHGVLKQSESRFIYRPHQTFSGRDQFSYRVYDGQEYSKTADVLISVQPFKGADRLTKQLERAIKQGGVAIGNGKKGGYIFRNGKYKPASILKLATALAALHFLGDDARFQTEFFLEQHRNLYIKGFADPSLTTAEWHRIAKELSSLGVFSEPVRQIVLDDSAIEKGTDFNGRGRSIHYFDAPLGALASNYNTAEVNIRPGHRVHPWKNRTPITNLSRRRAKGLPRGYQRFSIADDAQNGTRYSGELAREIFRRYGLINRPGIKLGTVPFSLGPIYIHDSSEQLKGIVKTMLYDSSNFIANQLLLAMAIDRYGEPARLNQGVDLLKRYLTQEQGLHSSDFSIVEGSGLSHYNQIDLAAMLDILNNFSEYRNLLPPLTKSKYIDLIRIGRRWHIKAKTGTMKGVSTLAGFLQKTDNEWLPFVIMLEGKPAERARVLKIICRFYARGGRKG